MAEDEREQQEIIESLAEEEIWEFLRIFVPDLAPDWELNGFASATAAEQDQYDDEADRSPTLPQLLDAFQSIYRINGAERLVRLGKSLVGPGFLEALTRNELKTRSLERSQKSRSQSGDTALTTSGTPDPTSEEPTPVDISQPDSASPSPDSST